jgi:CRP/FNR family cyclic AMP-dependent transcriptional regulator
VSDADALRQVSLFAGLADEDFAALASSLRRRRYPRGVTICLAGEPGEQFYLVERGRVRIGLTAPDGREVVLNMLGPGETFGELALLHGEPRSADATAQEDCLLLVLSRDAFLRHLQAHPRAALALLAEMGRRLRRNALIIQDAAFHDVPARLAAMLLQLAREHGEETADGATTVRITQVELAGMIGATRESVNKWLGSYERRGFLRRQRGVIAILDPDALRREVDAP